MLKIIYQDEHLVAINKPAGLLVHRSPIAPHEHHFALQELRNQLGQKVYAIHRLDRPTSGTLLFAKTPEAARELMGVFARKQTRKAYLVLVRGFLPENGIIDSPLDDVVDPTAADVPDSSPQSRSAVTEYRCLQNIEIPVQLGKFPTTRYALAAVYPVTGRRHQIRRHLRHISHPIIGDVKYGEGKHNRYFREAYGIHRLLLHAYRLTFFHPFLSKTITITADLPDDFQNLLKQLQVDEKIIETV